MTELKRYTVSVPDEIDEIIKMLQASEEYRDVPASKIIMTLVKRGLDAQKAEQ